MKRNYLILFLMSFVLLACAPAQIMKTSLRVTVLDELGNTVEGATVVLYANETDYRNSQNPLQKEVRTNAKGIAVIKDLDAKEYHVDVRKGDKNNNGGAVQTGVLQNGRINKTNIIIE